METQWQGEELGELPKDRTEEDYNAHYKELTNDRRKETNNRREKR